MVKRPITAFFNKKGDEDLSMGLEEWVYLLLAIILILILFVVVPLLKKILK